MPKNAPEYVDQRKYFEEEVSIASFPFFSGLYTEKAYFEKRIFYQELNKLLYR